MDKYQQILDESLQNIFRSAIEIMPTIILGILGIIAAWIIVKILLFVIKKILKAIKIDRLSDKITEAKLLGDREIKIDLIKLILGIVRVLLLLIFATIIAQVLGLEAVSDGISAIFAYLPTLVSALAIFAGGIYLASIVKKSSHSLIESMGISGAKAISNGLFYLIGFFISITALNQAGINTEIITSNFTLVLGAFLAAIALGFGLGSKEVFKDVLHTFYARKNFMVGDEIEVKGVKGSIQAIENISITIRTDQGDTVMPIDEFVNNRVVLTKKA